MSQFFRYFPHGVAGIFAIFWIFLAISPVDRDVWWAENIPLIAVFIALVTTSKSFRFSDLSYFFMACWLFWHTIGGHYTFANVPFFADFSTWLGFERNHFDRVGHFMIGFYAYPIVELLRRKNWVQGIPSLLFGLFAIMALAAGYEIVEWIYAVTKGGSAGIEFLGSQGDVWDAQKDMLCDTLGAIFSLLFFTIPLFQINTPKK